MKKSLSIIVGLILLSPLAFAANEATISSGVIITVGGYNLTVNGEYAIDSLVVGSDSFDVTLVAGKSFGVNSSDRRKLTVSPVTYVNVTSTCTSSESTATMNTTQDSGSITVTVTPSTSQLCSGGGGGDSGSGAVGGGTGSIASYNYGATPATPATPAVSPATPATPSAQAISSASAVAQAVSPAFNKDLVLGNRSDDVKRLQQLLATDKSIYPEGQATGFYGALTQKAVRSFQKKYGLPQVGRVGPATRAKLQEVFGSSAPSAPAESASVESLQALIASLQKQIQDILKARQQ